ncbi:MAG TPA: hypothetical protein VHE13_13030 [Opitutus sp.]|nr:hypothetical protein [Opitutus sp.]
MKLSTGTERTLAISIIAILCIGSVASPPPASELERIFRWFGALLVGGSMINGFVRRSARVALFNGFIWLAAFLMGAVLFFTQSPKPHEALPFVTAMNLVLIPALTLLSFDLWSQWRTSSSGDRP